MAQKTQSEALKQLREYVKKSIQPGREPITFLPASNSWKRGDKPVTTSSLGRRLGVELNMSTERATHMLEIIGEDEHDILEAALQNWVRKLEARGKCERELRKFITIMQREGTDALTHECHVWCFKQWVWQIKRHIMRRKVTYPVMPILYSVEEGTGKSYNIDRLLSPLEGFHRKMDVDELGEQFSNKLMSQTRVAFFDELSGIREANAAKFKSFMTGRAFAGRSMFSESGFSAENRTSCIACTNDMPPHGIENSSGARRIWSMHCTGRRKGADEAARAALDAINWNDVWLCVGYEEDSIEHQLPPAVAERMVAVRQEMLRCPDTLEQFWREQLESAKDPEVLVELREIQRAYKAYCSRCSTPAIKTTHAMLKRRFLERGVEVVNHSGHLKCKGIRVLTFEEALTET